MRVIKIPFLVEAAKKHPKARKWIENWCAITREVNWKNIQEVRASYPSADTVTVNSGSNVVVFNVCGNDFRLIVAIHYNRGIVYTMRFLTHAEYSKEKWKKEL
jgi:mRNA interferase HigB